MVSASQRKRSTPPTRMTTTFDIPYAPGQLTALASTAGREIGRKTFTTVGARRIARIEDGRCASLTPIADKSPLKCRYSLRRGERNEEMAQGASHLRSLNSLPRLKKIIVCGHALFPPATDMVSQPRLLVSRHRIICNPLCNWHCLASA
jgi:hypothetical protein